jgi:hypothetical protein
MGQRRSGIGWLAVVWMCVLALLVGCSSGTPEAPGGGAGQFGDRCTKSEDCASLLCVRLTADTGLCSTACVTNSTCPNADNWECLTTPTIQASVCACLPLSDTEVCNDGLDNDCNGRVDDCQICDGRPVPRDDHDHCGSCDQACRSDQRCEEGDCSCGPESPLECGGSCTDPERDANNCGGCGLDCGSDRVCADGSCRCPSFERRDYCALVGCVDLQNDDQHCGTCSNVCTLGQTCNAGKCVCPAGAPADFCEGVGCVDLQADEKNCGECGTTCVSTQTCNAGQCRCPTGQELCDGVCVDTKQNAQHCGSCGNACPAALACIGGSCDCSAPGYEVCGAECAALASDPLHCGDCKTDCAPGETCAAGQCGCPSSVYCDDECMPVDDDQNCGSCGHACPSGQYCQGGQCACAGFGLTPCGTACVSLTSDEGHCGSCETQCKNTEQCGALGCACPGGQTFCDNVNACVSLSTDEAHCGSCSKACNPTEVCASSSCGCPAVGQKYCASQNACTDTLSNEAHCGSCDHACRPTEECSGGNCACPSGESFCAGVNACVDLANDSLHCGACGKACPAGTHCAGSTCACDVPGQTLCGTVCYDLQNDPDHCGTCSNDCGGAYQCKGGACKCPQPVLGTEVRVTSSKDRTKPRIVFDGTHVGVIHSSFQQLVDNSLRFLQLNPDGTPVAGVDVQLQNPVWGAYDLAWNGSEYAVVADNSNNYTILVRRLGADGVAKDAGVSFSAQVDQFLRLVWSPSYGGYVVAYDGGFPGSVYMRRIGADGTSPEAGQAWDWSSASSASNLVVTDDGSFGLLVNDNQRLYLERSNSSGVPFLPPAQLDDSTGALPLYGALGYDSNGFYSIWSNLRQVLVNRGNTLNGPTRLFTVAENEAPQSFSHAQVGDTMALAWSQRVPNGVGGLNGSHRFRLQRFKLPDATTGAAAPITDALEIVSAHATYDVRIVRTGPYRLLAVWADGRNGSDSRHDLYAVPIDLQSCP